VVDKKNILHRCEITQPGRKKLITSDYEKTESVLLEWFRHKQEISVQGSVLRQKAETKC
jgi:hypothetical protein